MSSTLQANSTVHIYRLNGQGGAESVTQLAVLPAPTLWVHMQSEDPECAPVMTRLGLGLQVIDVLTSPETRPLTTAMKEGVLMVLRGVNPTQDVDPEDLVDQPAHCHCA